MKKCDHIEELILTSYLDGELDKISVSKLEKHLLGCSDCRHFLKEVKSNAVMPFQRAVEPVPAGLWSAVKQTIEDEKQKPYAWEGFLEDVRDWMIFPKLFPVWGSLVVMLLVGSVTLDTLQMQQTQDKDQGEYLISLLNPSPQADNNDGQIQTPIEHYFL